MKNAIKRISKLRGDGLALVIFGIICPITCAALIFFGVPKHDELSIILMLSIAIPVPLLTLGAASDCTREF